MLVTAQSKAPTSSVPLENVRNFYGKVHLGENGKIWYCERRLLAIEGLLRCSISSELLRIMLHGQGLVTELLLRKNGGKEGYIKDTTTCVGMEVCVCTGSRWVSETGWLYVVLATAQGRL